MARRDDTQLIEDDPLWYKNAVIYQTHVRAFYDSDGDGSGDFRGLSQRLDYLQDLGITAIWLLPFYPSPLRDDGYDIADYQGVHPSYGTTRDFKQFVAEAHRRGLRVITELVINHTSDQHRWFQRARRAKPGSRYRDWYVWSDTPEKYRGVRIIFKDFEQSNWTWDPVAGAYFWHRFYSHQPDLNFDNPEVRKQIFKLMDHWLEMGVDGLRLDAVPYLFEREGTTCENLTETHGYLKELRAHIDRNWDNRMLLAEANMWPEDAVAYFGDGDECHMAFHFPVMPRLFMGIHMEDRFPIVDILQQTPDIPENAQWAVFLRNHDELTLEMVTDEERDYMYRVYADERQARINLGIRRRLSPLLGGNRRKIELMNGLLFSLPGTPIIYYGDEIGMGDNIYLGDRDGVRTPMQWNADRNAGFSRANPHKLYLPVNIDPEYRYESVNVEAQQNNPHSLLWWMRRLITLRQRYDAFGFGTLIHAQPSNPKVLAFIREHGDQRILVVANLSRFVQAAEIDLSEYKGLVPVELFGQTRFPPIGELPYFLTLGPHGFYWLSLEAMETGEMPVHLRSPEAEVPAVPLAADWTSLFSGRPKRHFEGILPEAIRGHRWFGGKARAIQSVSIIDTVPLGGSVASPRLAMVRVVYTEGEPESYVLVLGFASGERAEELAREKPRAIFARTQGRGKGVSGIIYDALHDEDTARGLLGVIARRRQLKGTHGVVTGWPSRAHRRDLAEGVMELEPEVVGAEQSNTSVIYDGRYIMKLYRRLAAGVNPDLEIGRFLTRAGFQHAPPVVGALEYTEGRQEPRTLALLQGFVPNEGDAWRYTLDAQGAYFEQVLALQKAADIEPPPLESPVVRARREVPAIAWDLLGPFIQTTELLGRRSAEMHLALASDTEDPAFAPEPFTAHYQRGLYQSMRNQARQSFGLLRSRLPTLPEDVQESARIALDSEADILRRLRPIADHRISALRIRHHGDYHLGQVLFTGRDFVIIDFEGEPARPLSERRLKRSPLRDVAGMLRSFHYAAWVGYFDQASRWGADSNPELQSTLQRGARCWHTWISGAFVRGYLDALGDSPLIPSVPADLELLLDAYLFEKAAYELSYELNNRPDWVAIPLQGLIQRPEASR